MSQEEQEEQERPTVSREDLYELVWSKPMRELARDFGISDVALAKRCRRLGIPAPGRGYWARIDAGQQPYRPKLPQRDRQWSDEGALTVGLSRQDARAEGCSEGDQETESESSIARRDDTWLQEKLAFEELPHNAVTVPAHTAQWDATIARCRDDLEQAAKKLRASKKASDEYDKWPERRKRERSDSDGYAWRRARDRGERLWDTHKAVCFRVSLGTYERALAIVNALALAARTRGFIVREDEEEGRIVFAGHDAEVQLRLTEALETKTRPRTRYDGEVEQERYYIPTGRLVITLQIGYREGPTVRDRETRPLESQLNRVFCGIYRLVVKVWQREREHQAFHRKLEEEARQRAEIERIQAERAKALVEERAQRRRLLSETNRWTQSIRIRKYVAHLDAQTGERPANGGLSEWKTWALNVATTLDPTEARLSNDKTGRTDPSDE